MAEPSTELAVLQVCADPDNESFFRVLVGGRFVKYVTIDQGVYDLDDMCFAPVLIPMLPPLPSGDWNEARISRHAQTGSPCFSSSAKKEFRGITTVWHPTRIDHLELSGQEKLRSNVYEVSCPGFDSRVIAKFARFEWEIPQLEDETEAYSWLKGSNVGPEFLGHLTEEGRVIGFLVARIQDFRHATVEDLPLCQAALRKLHGLGIKHGDVNKHNFLIHGGGATLIDFDLASKTADESELQAELEKLPSELCDTSGRGGVVVEEPM